MCYLHVAGNVSDNVTYIVPGSLEHRELWMIRLREVIVLLFMTVIFIIRLKWWNFMSC